MSTLSQPWMERIEQLRAEGAINEDDESTLIRYVNDHQALIEQELAAITPEYRRRTATQGAEAADAWLAETAQALGRREGEKLRRIFDQIPCANGLSNPA